MELWYHLANVLYVVSYLVTDILWLRVLRDVQNELVSPASARDDYGVVLVLDTSALAVDEAATTRRRRELRAARGWAAPPFVSR